MAWKLSGKSMEFCSCTLMCPCWISADVTPDKDWCSGTLVFDIESGSSDGVDLSGSTVVVSAHWPGNFFGGNGTARVYLPNGATEQQRAQLESIFTGRKGGHLEGLFGAVISDWLPTETTDIEVQWEGNPSLRVGTVGDATLVPIMDANGKRTRVTGAAAQAGFQIDGMDLADSRNSRWADPELKPWEGSSGTLHEFSWTA